MGLFSSKVEQCVIDAPEFRESLGKLIVLTDVIEKLALALSKDPMSANTKFELLPPFLIQDAVNSSNSDSLEDNIISRYNAYIAFFKQLDKDMRRSSAEKILTDLINLRQYLGQNMTKLC